MNISATIQNSYQVNKARVTTNGTEKDLLIPSKTEGFGSSINGGELLFLSLQLVFAMMYTGKLPVKI